MEAELGAGGMGAVFRATHLGTERAVALKIIAPQLMNDGDSLERFKREARAAGRLQHPNVVNVTDFGIADVDQQRVAYLAMEFLEGFTLGELLRRQKKLPVSLTVDILDQVAIAIDEAHRLGIIHRDLKPENIWLSDDRRGGYQVKVLDFGVAAFRESAIAEETHGDPKMTAVTTAVATPHLTRAGSVIGTPAYMSPEQCGGRTAGVFSDIYSLGVIAYQMMTGNLPFTGNTVELIAKHIAAPPPELTGVPKRVAEVVLSALEKDPERRPVSATAFAGALRARSEGATMTFRRAVAVYAVRFDELIRLAAVAHVALIAWTVIAVPLLAVYGLRAIGVLVVSTLAMIPGDTTCTALVYLAVDHLRRHPLEPISWRELIRQFGEKTGAPEPLKPSRLLLHSFRVMRLNARLTRELLFRALGRGSPLIALFALLDHDADVQKAVTVSRELSRGASWRIRMTEYGFVLLALFVLSCFILLTFLEPLGVAPSIASLIARVFLVICALGLATLAVLFSPLMAVAQAIYYFHARQAAGEEVSFSLDPRL